MRGNALGPLNHVRWSFFEPVPNSLESFIVAVDEYADSVEMPSQKELLGEKTPYREVDIKYEYWTQRESGEWEAIPITVHLEKNGTERFTNGELLWKVHTVCHPHLREQDHYYFEGFSPVGDSAEGTPAFEIIREVSCRAVTPNTSFESRRSASAAQLTR